MTALRRLAALAGVALGCADDTVAVTADAFPNAYYTTLCASIFRCPQGPWTRHNVGYLEDPTTCVDRVSRYAWPDLDDLLRHVRAGSVRFDAAAARACLDRVAATCVQDDDEMVRVCRPAFVGTLPEGGACWRTEQCAFGLWCDHGAKQPRRCPGVCAPGILPAGLGVPPSRCASSPQCVGWQRGTAQCGPGACAGIQLGPPGLEGQSCEERIVNGVYLRTQCAAGLACHYNVCRRALPAGAACQTTENPCAAGLWCGQAPGAMGSTCTPVARFVASTPGVACDPSGTPVACNPLARLTCNIRSVCEPLGDGTAGARCDPSGFLTTCNDGLRCDIPTSTCVVLAPTGGSCQRDLECRSGACVGGVCLDRRCE
jgi:hypothetical protein